MKILLAADGSPSAIEATRSLVETARLFKESVEVELVAVHLPVPDFGGMGSAVVTKEMIHRYYEDECNAMLKASSALLDEAHIAYRPNILVGRIAETIVDHGKKSGCAMIYMGTRGMTALSNAMMGSIATKVVHLARVPVVLIP